DKPALYFNYALDSGQQLSGFKSSARVFVSPDGGKTWDEIATNNPKQTVYDPSVDPMTGSLSGRQVDQIGFSQPPTGSELPDVVTASANVPATTLNGRSVVDPRQQVQPLFDQSVPVTDPKQDPDADKTTIKVWRQARIDLGNYAGDQNLMLRFDFSTSGSIGQGQYNDYPNGPFAYKSDLPHQFPDPAADGAPIPGDYYGNPGKATRAQNNEHEGWYLDDLIVGLAGRGEMVTNAPAAQTQFFTTPQNPNFGASTEILTGAYQLDIQKGTPTGQTINPARPGIILYPNQLDVTDRQTSAYTLIAPEGHFNQSQTQTPGNVGLTAAAPPVYTFTFTNVPAATGDGTVTISGTGDFEGADEYLTLDFPDLAATDPVRQQLQQSVFFIQQDKGLQGQFFTSSPIHVTQAQWLALLAAGQKQHGASVITLTLTPVATTTGTPVQSDLSGKTLMPGSTLVNGLLALTATVDYGTAGAFDGQTFTISDGIHQRVFELDDNNQLNNPTDLRVTYAPTDTGAQIAQAIVAAINTANGPLFKVLAATDDAANNNPTPSATNHDNPSDTTGDTSDRINLFGAASVQVGPPQQVVSGANPPNSGNAPQPPHNTIAVAYNTGLDSEPDATLPPSPSLFGPPVLPAGLTSRVFNGYGVIGNAAGVGTSPQVDLMQVYLHAGDAMTVQLDTKTILSPLKALVRLFDSSGVDLTTSFQDAAQEPFGSLNGFGLGLRQFDAAGNNIYLPPPVGQPGTADDLYYTFTAQQSGYYYVGVSGQGNKNYQAFAGGDSAERGSTGYYQIHLSVGPINLRGTNLPHNDPHPFYPPFAGFNFPFVNLADNQEVPPDNTVNIGTLFYRSPDLNSDTADSFIGFDGIGTNDTTLRVVKYDNMLGDTQVARPQGAVILESNQVSNTLNDGIWVTAAPRENMPGAPDPNLPHQGA
ncbi:MAG: hypothetical protein ACREJM_15935, partial [Candidatus Saccharimonadales bacterium]